MKKSAVAGVAGSIRIDPLTLGQLAAQERHGKREDLTSQARAIRDVAPLITNGLNLRVLYERHVEGYFVPKGRTKVLHVLIQFPKDLVDLKDEAGLLRHALQISQRLWGENCVMAARYDRDERSQGVADIFVVPKYLKITKANPAGKPAVAMTKHGKDLAQKWKRATGKGKKGQPQSAPWDIGRALQDELYDYLENVMMLDGVQRGEMKQVIGPDRKGPEELRDAEFAERTKRLHDREREQAIRESELEKKRADAEKLHNAAVLALQKIPELKDEAETRGYEEGFASGKADAEASCAKQLKADREALEQEAELRKRAIEQMQEMQERQRSDLALNIERAKADRKKAEADQAEARRERQAVKAGIEALSDGDIVGGRPGAGPDERRMVFRAGLDRVERQSLARAIAPVWNWLSEQAERLALVVMKRFEERAKKLESKEADLQVKTARVDARYQQLDQKEARLNALMEQTRSAAGAFKSAIEPLSSWNAKFDAGSRMIKQVMAIGPRNEIVSEALSDPHVKRATRAEEEFDSLAASFAAIQRESKGRG